MLKSIAVQQCISDGFTVCGQKIWISISDCWDLVPMKRTFHNRSWQTERWLLWWRMVILNGYLWWKCRVAVHTKVSVNLKYWWAVQFRIKVKNTHLHQTTTLVLNSSIQCVQGCWNRLQLNCFFIQVPQEIVKGSAINILNGNGGVLWGHGTMQHCPKYWISICQDSPITRETPLFRPHKKDDIAASLTVKQRVPPSWQQGLRTGTVVVRTHR